MRISEYDVVVAGAGFFGATIAERCASELGKRVLVVDKRHHVGGNAYSEVDAETSIEVHKYGSHLFHTSNDDIWAYLNRFSRFTGYTHKVFTSYRGSVYPMPINLATMCQFYQRHMSPCQARALVCMQASELEGRSPRNLEEKAISLIGRPLYEAFVRGYTAKQWQTDPRNLPSTIISRLPVRFTFDNRYFNDKHEGLPSEGYTELFRTMLSHKKIDVRLGVDFFNIRNGISPRAVVVYTGPIDRYFDYRAGELQWRTLDFDTEVVSVRDYQGTSVMNYADEAVPYTRIHEFRHLYPERRYPADKTVIMREYSRSAGRCDEPYYPVNTRTDRKTYLAYRGMASMERNVIFGGRLGTYRYLDMHQAIGAALKSFSSEIVPAFMRETAPVPDVAATTG